MPEPQKSDDLNADMAAQVQQLRPHVGALQTVRANEHLFRSLSNLTWLGLRAIEDTVATLPAEEQAAWRAIDQAWNAAYDEHRTNRG